MIRFQYIVLILYVAIAVFSYAYLKRAYFPQHANMIEKIIAGALCSCWIISIPTTWILRASNNDEEAHLPTSVYGFFGSET